MEYMVSIENKHNSNEISKPNIRYTRRIQSRLNSAKNSDVEWKELSQKLYKASIESNLENKDCLELSNIVVKDWFSKNDTLTHNNCRRKKEMLNYNEWECEFIKELTYEENMKEIIFFNRNESINVWVIIDEATIDNIKKFSDIYINFLMKNEDLNFEFLVFEEEDIEEINLNHFENVRRVKES